MLFRVTNGVFLQSYETSMSKCTCGNMHSSYDTAGYTGSSNVKSKRSRWLRLVIRMDKGRMANRFFRALQQIGDRGSTVVKVLCYKSKGRWFDSRWCHSNFSLTYSFRSHYGPGVDSASNRNEYQEYLLGVKNGRCVRLTTLPPSWATVT